MTKTRVTKAPRVQPMASNDKLNSDDSCANACSIEGSRDRLLVYLCIVSLPELTRDAVGGVVKLLAGLGS